MNYHVARNGQQLGVLSSTDISLKLSTGDLSPQDLAWTEGMTNWQPISTISGLAANSTYVPPPLEFNPYAAPRSAVVRRDIPSAELAGLGDRLAASLLDGVAAIPMIILIGIAIATMDRETEELTSTGMLMAGLGLAYGLALMIYNLVRLSTHGQTLGKKWMSIRIASFEDNGNAGFVKAVMLRGIVNALIGGFVPFYGIVDIFFIFRNDHRCIHDLLAGTHVVKV